MSFKVGSHYVPPMYVEVPAHRRAELPYLARGDLDKNIASCCNYERAIQLLHSRADSAPFRSFVPFINWTAFHCHSSRGPPRHLTGNELAMQFFPFECAVLWHASIVPVNAGYHAYTSPA